MLTQFAEKYKLEGAPISITIGTVNGEKRRETKLYVVELLTRSGQRRLVRAFGVENISQDVPYICFKGVNHFFNLAIQEDWENVTDRQSGIIPSAQQYTNRIIVREVHMMNGKEFMEAKAIGVEPPRLCPDCRVCQKCIFRGQQHTERETF